jgi:hypothetical protein
VLRLRSAHVLASDAQLGAYSFSLEAIHTQLETPFEVRDSWVAVPDAAAPERVCGLVRLALTEPDRVLLLDTENERDLEKEIVVDAVTEPSGDRLRVSDADAEKDREVLRDREAEAVAEKERVVDGDVDGVNEAPPEMVREMLWLPDSVRLTLRVRVALRDTDAETDADADKLRETLREAEVVTDGVAATIAITRTSWFMPSLT